MTDDEDKSWFGSWIEGVKSWLGDHHVLARTFIGYAFVIFVGFIVMQFFDRRKPAEFVALKMLQPNHRLVAEDIAEAGFWHRFLVPSMTTLDDFYGRYVKDCVNKDDPIGLDETVSGLQLATPSSIGWLELSELPLADVVSLDVGDQIQVCNVKGDEACDTAQKVAAIACPDKAMSAACSVGVIMSDAQRVLLARARDKGDAASISSPVPAPGGTTTDESKKKKPGKHAKSDNRPRSATSAPEAKPAASSADTASSDATSAVHVIVHHTTPVPCSPSPAPAHPQPSMSGHH